MPDTAEHRADMYQLAKERRKAGEPSWAHKINLRGVFHNDELTFEQKRDTTVRRIRATTWFKDYGEYDELPQLVEELSETESVHDFDVVFDCIYDIADADHVWIATF